MQLKYKSKKEKFRQHLGLGEKRFLSSLVSSFLCCKTFFMSVFSLLQESSQQRTENYKNKNKNWFGFFVFASISRILVGGQYAKKKFSTWLLFSIQLLFSFASKVKQKREERLKTSSRLKILTRSRDEDTRMEEKE